MDTDQLHASLPAPGTHTAKQHIRSYREYLFLIPRRSSAAAILYKLVTQFIRQGDLTVSHFRFRIRHYRDSVFQMHRFCDTYDLLLKIKIRPGKCHQFPFPYAGPVQRLKTGKYSNFSLNSDKGKYISVTFHYVSDTNLHKAVII